MTKLLSVPAAAERLGISRTSPWRLVRRGLIASHKFPVGGTRIHPADLEAFVAKCRREPVAYIPTARKPRMTAGEFAAVTKRQALRQIRRSG